MSEELAEVASMDIYEDARKLLAEVISRPPVSTDDRSLQILAAGLLMISDSLRQRSREE